MFTSRRVPPSGLKLKVNSFPFSNARTKPVLFPLSQSLFETIDGSPLIVRGFTQSSKVNELVFSSPLMVFPKFTCSLDAVPAKFAENLEP